jgi:hypothetical protein
VTYTNWHDGRKPGAPWNGPSPNVRAILDYCNAKWGLTDLGCYGVRPIRGGTRWSAHAFGAAQDMSYRAGPDRSVIESEVIPFLVDNADRLGIQRVHDYWSKRYWQSGRGWVNRPPGSRNDHLHVETTAEAWAETRSVEERLGAPAPAKRAKWVTVKRGDNGDGVRKVQEVLRREGYKNSTGKKLLVVDGDFGANTDKRTRQYQADRGLVSDGIVGPITAGRMGLT